MGDDSISKRISLSIGTEGEAVGPVRMKGAYRFATHGQRAEIELVEIESLERSVVYAGPADSLLSIPDGTYRLYGRRPSEDAGNAPVELERLTLVGRAALNLSKVVDLVRHGRVDKLIAAQASLQSRRSGIVGTRLGASIAAAAPGLERTVLLPAAVPAELRFVSVIIPTKERADLLSACITSLDMITDVSLELIVVDNGATREEMVAYLETLRSRPSTRVLRRDGPFNFSWLCNEGARAATAPVLVFLNDDIEALDGGWLAAMLGYLARNDAGVVGARLLYPSGALQHAGIAANLVPGPGHPWLGLTREQWQTNAFVTGSGEVDAVTAACLMIRKDLFDRLGGFNEDDFAVTVNDVDLCLRARERGRRVIYAAQATLIHKEGQSRRRDDRPEERERRQRELAAFYQRHEACARTSCFYPPWLRRDTVSAEPI